MARQPVTGDLFGAPQAPAATPPEERDYHAEVKPTHVFPVKSSNLSGVGYDFANQVLHVRFRGNGNLYVYHDFTKEEWETHPKNGDSWGKWFREKAGGVKKCTTILPREQEERGLLAEVNERLLWGPDGWEPEVRKDLPWDGDVAACLGADFLTQARWLKSLWGDGPENPEQLARIRSRLAEAFRMGMAFARDTDYGIRERR